MITTVIGRFTLGTLLLDGAAGGKGTTSKGMKFQLRPDPLAR